MCPFRHISGEKTVVCKHWLRGLCKKGDQCEFLHEYDMTKMPECYFYSKFGECSNKECPFLHIDPDSKIKDCPCPRFELPMGTSEQPSLPQQAQNQTKPVPSISRSSHSLIQLTNSSPGQRPQNNANAAVHQNNMSVNRGPRPLDQVTCYKCGEKGHYANKCTKGHLAFLSGQ
ncbi:cleavage and polyadenylation specificity factor subunit 4 [Kryptolebias marmoratus]|uniref:cleavage and polyadenylation specificity factor subunit 4 n=1 Tax=Kryptolebias marmoratus TaxID=37003 RepID=UPI000D530AAA|nr:cleavage and polyadenylation specificity factor subunit 4 [Kryptolebias marmoratus]